MQTINLEEAFDYKKAAVGTIKFPASTVTDPFIVKVIKLLGNNNPSEEQEIIDHLNTKQTEINELAIKAPIIYTTMKHNVIEGELFNMFWKQDIDVPGAPEFSNVTFHKLIRNIEGNHHEMFPMRSFIDDRPLPEKKIDYTYDAPDTKGAITKAAATPGGTFIFNVPFMQKLMDWAYLKDVKPARPIYQDKGGPFPNEYSYLEFLIMHEFMHYTNDDFYYSQTIPNANNQIINWVGDFRSNYLLTKSGYEALPIGLYCDEINYDRQNSYMEMYHLVEEEMSKLPPPERKKVGDDMDGSSGDNHQPGQTEGKSAANKEKVDKKQETEAAKGKDINDDMSDHGKKEAEKVEEGATRVDTKSDKKEVNGEKSGPGGPGGSNTAGAKTDVKAVSPTFNWQSIIRKCIPTDTFQKEENYGKINRRAISSLDIARQTGAGYLPPAETDVPLDEIHVAFVMDTSSSMDQAVPVIMANAINLLKNPIFNKSIISIYKFASSHSLQKVNIGLKKSTTCSSIKDKPKQWPNSASHAFTFNFSGGTSLDAALLTELQLALQMKYNIIICTDVDILRGANYTNFAKLVRQAPKQVFVIFDKYTSYVLARQMGCTTSNMTHF